MKIPFFDYRRQYKKIKPEIDMAIKRVLNSGKLILAEEVRNFENNFSNYTGTKYGIGVNSGTDALKIALRALDIKQGDEIITVSNTAVPTVSAIREAGAKPVFVDIKDDYTINEKLIEKNVTEKTKAIVPVHLYGQLCNLQVILKIAKKYKLKVIEDCCQAHGAKINGQSVGTFGDFGCFSFYPTKNLGAYGDGGMILTSDKNLAEKCQALRMYGMKNGYYSKMEGYNSQLDEIQAAILNVKLKYLDRWLAQRRQIAKFYLNNIKNPHLILPPISNLDNHSFHLFVIRTTQRTKLINYLSKNGIGYGIHYPRPIHLQNAYKFLGYKKKSLPTTEKFCNQVVSLPIFPELTSKELKFITNKINQWLKK